MSKHWKPEIGEDASAARRRRILGADPDRSVRDRMRSLRGGATPEPKEMVVIDGACHLFDGQGREVGDALEDLLGDFS